MAVRSTGILIPQPLIAGLREVVEFASAHDYGVVFLS
jgi:hypothetical protein